MAGFNYVLTLRAMAGMAAALPPADYPHAAADAARYASLASNATAGFHAAFYNEALGAYGGDQVMGQSVTFFAANFSINIVMQFVVVIVV
jgi:hypothetical protein